MMSFLTHHSKNTSTKIITPLHAIVSTGDMETLKYYLSLLIKHSSLKTQDFLKKYFIEDRNRPRPHYSEKNNNHPMNQFVIACKKNTSQALAQLLDLPQSISSHASLSNAMENYTEKLNNLRCSVALSPIDPPPLETNLFAEGIERTYPGFSLPKIPSIFYFANTKNSFKRMILSSLYYPTTAGLNK